MQKNRYFTLSLLTAAIFSGCSTLPPQNSALDAARSSYNTARSNAQVTKLAPLELQDAGETLSKADAALTKGDDATVNQLAYLAKQKVAIAQATAKRKAAELDVTSSSAQREQVRLSARTAEADAAKKRAEIAQKTADERAKALAVAAAKAEKDQALIATRMAELEEAKKQAMLAQQAAEQQAAALATARAKAEQDQARIEAANAKAEQDQARIAAATTQAEKDRALIEARAAEVEEARKQAELAQQAANEQAAALAEAKAKAEKAQALIAQQEMQLKELNAKQTSRGMVITLGDVLFNTNQAQLSSGGINNVKKLADFLNKNPQRKVMIEGHTDSKGSDSYNQALSERRAEAVQKSLVDLGIGSDRIATRGYGESSPVANNETAAGRQLNRRVEVILSDDKGTITPR